MNAAITVVRFGSLALAATIATLALDGCPKPSDLPAPDSGFLTDGPPPREEPPDRPDPPPREDPPPECPGSAQCPCDLGCSGPLQCAPHHACADVCTSDADCSSSYSGETCLHEPGRAGWCAILCDPRALHGGCPVIASRQSACMLVAGGVHVCGFGGGR